MQSIAEFFSQFNTDKTNELIRGKVTVKVYPKGKILQLRGDQATTCFFVKKGLLRSYVIDRKGKEHVFMFAPEGWIMADIQSLNAREPSELFIDTLEESEVELFTVDFLADLISLNPANEKGFITLLTKRNAVLQQRVLMLMSESATERYEHFTDTYPNIVQRVPLRLIASYLGITPEALSKLRGDLSKKK